jgi:hypothetical protein
MIVEERLRLVDELNSESRDILLSKGKAYASNNDTLANFKRIAERFDISKYIVWGVYFNKHIDSINNAILHNPTHPKDESEGLKGRIIDAKNYLDILYCLLSEDGEL